MTRRLDHIQSLGADTVYLTPIFPARSNHRYNASTFEHVDPLLGGDEALHRLSGALHARGMAAARRHHHQPHRRHARMVSPPPSPT
ncbi:alpha-amylase family glycosyl hydrolase [Nonomuraea rubra]|uniref:alpha-amylase family glycosyl hydrolase n=1 Tax=Nonomuraea rubra TaxID=46180 RepID=UPI0031ECEE80